jgi:hypothetical protein
MKDPAGFPTGSFYLLSERPVSRRCHAVSYSTIVTVSPSGTFASTHSMSSSWSVR